MMRAQSAVYPAYNDIEVLATQYGLDSDHVYAFAAFNRRLPVSKNEQQTFEQMVQAQACRIQGCGVQGSKCAPECEGLTSSAWDRVGHLWWGFIKTYGRLPGSQYEYAIYLENIGFWSPTTGPVSGAHVPADSDGYPPSGGTVGSSTGGTGPVTVCGQTITWDTVDTGLRLSGYTGRYGHDQAEAAAYERAACPGSGSSGGGSGGPGPRSTQCDSVTNNPQIDTLICWVKSNTPLAIGGAALLYLIYRGRG